MSRRDDLIALRDAVQNGESILPGQLDGTGLQIHPFSHAYNGSVDAALAFLAAELPGWIVGYVQQFASGTWYVQLYKPMPDWPTPFPEVVSNSTDPARALLLASLAALIAEFDI